MAVQAIGSAGPVMRPDRFEAVLSRLLPAVLALARKEKDNLFGVVALGNLLDVAATQCPVALEVHYKGLLPEVRLSFLMKLHFFEKRIAMFLFVSVTDLHKLHAAAMVVPAAENVNALRVYNEWMRSWEAVARADPGNILQFVLSKIEQPQGRFGTLLVLRHLISRLGNNQ